MLFALAFLALQSATLKIGDLAPPLAIDSYLHGGPVAKIDPAKIYVIEFWGVWCGPCVRVMPHMCVLQKENPDVVFVGVDELDDQATAEKFVSEHGKNLSYVLARDQGGSVALGATGKAYMTASGETGFPGAFIVWKGKLAWLGHPRAIEEPLAKIRKGDWNFRQALEEYRSQPKLDDEVGQVSKERDAALAASDSNAYNAMLRRSKRSSVRFLVEFQNLSVWRAVAPDSKVEHPDLAVCAQIEEFVVKLERRQNPYSLNTLARVYVLQGKKVEARKALQDAIAQADEEYRKELEATLKSVQ